MLDRFIPEFDRALRAVAGVTRASRPNPAAAIVTGAEDTAKLSEPERRHAAGLMRVNHVGEVCAQALYQGQALFAREPAIRAQLDEAAREEEDHLAWCAQRLQELNDRPSLLNPLWYAGAFAIGALAGRLGDKISLGFVAETERQVEHHLDGHLDRLPEQDARSRAIVAQMRDDEVRHGDNARAAGGVELPEPIRRAMRAASRDMTTTASRICRRPRDARAARLRHSSEPARDGSLTVAAPVVLSRGFSINHAISFISLGKPLRHLGAVVLSHCSDCKKSS